MRTVRLTLVENEQQGVSPGAVSIYAVIVGKGGAREDVPIHDNAKRVESLDIRTLRTSREVLEELVSLVEKEIGEKASGSDMFRGTTADRGYPTAERHCSWLMGYDPAIARKLWDGDQAAEREVRRQNLERNERIVGIFDSYAAREDDR